MLNFTTDSLRSDTPMTDLGPLAWVFDELRKSLDGASKAIKRFVHEASQTLSDDLETPDPAPLRSARQQLHQAVGALEMVGLAQPAQVLRGMEAVVARFVQRPQTCDAAAVQQVEQAGLSLLEYLQALLNNKVVQPLALFPIYRDVQKLAAFDRIHPADLWSFDRHGLNMSAPLGVQPMQPTEVLRSLFERSVALVVKTQSVAASQSLTRLCAGLAAGADTPRLCTFWYVAAAYFEGTAALCMPTDVYAKQSASRIFLQFNALVPGIEKNANSMSDTVHVSETLLRDLLFFCAYAKKAGVDVSTPYLTEVRRIFGLQDTQWIDYTSPLFGRFDPALLVQARKRVHMAKESWGMFTGGETNRGSQVSDQYSLLGESLIKLYPASVDLAGTLNNVVEHAVREAKTAIRPELAMEVATTTLYLEASLEDFDPADVAFGARCNQLSERLRHVLNGEHGRPLEPWMEQLYRRVSDRKTMVSVVGELRVSLAEIEKTLDQFFRAPHEKACLSLLAPHFLQLRGVLSVLGLGQAVQTVIHMRMIVDQMLKADRLADTDRDARQFQQIGRNLSALSFLVDMLNYQPMLAKKLFVFDEKQGELKPLMGRSAATQPLTDASPKAIEADEQPQVQEQSRLVSGALGEIGTALPVAATQMTLVRGEGEQELRGIFLEEAREVVTNGHEAIRQLQVNAGDLEPLTTLRRAFHTLKGSARMVNLLTFGEAAWAMEQLFNASLAEQRSASPDILRMAHQALSAFSRWIDDIDSPLESVWQAQPFVDSAEALRNQLPFLPLKVPGVENLVPFAAWPAQPSLETLPTQPAKAPHKDEVMAKKASAQDLTNIDLAAAPVEFGVSTTDVEPIDDDSAISALSDHFELAYEASLADGEPAVQFTDVEIVEAPFATFSHLPLTLDESKGVLPEGDSVEAEDPLPLLDEWVDVDTPTDEGSAEAAFFELDTKQLIEYPPVIGGIKDSPLLEGIPDEQTRLIGPLRIDLKLCNVYLNEADEWSRRLGSVLSEWLLEFHEPLPEQAQSLAHSLAGSSAAVGFQPLSDIARALESALCTVAAHQSEGRAAQLYQAQLFVDAAENIRHLLHQFAAGFFKEPSAELLRDLHQLPLKLPPLGDDMPLNAALSAREENELAKPVFDAALSYSGVKRGDVTLVLSAPDSRTSQVGSVSSRKASLPQQVGLAKPAQDIDDDIDALDTIDVDLFPIFSEEALELLPRLGAALRQWIARLDNASARAEVLRNLHTLKGSARLAGALRLGEMVHRMETEVDGVDMAALNAASVAPLLGFYDAIVERLESLRSMDPVAHGVLQTAPELTSLLHEPASPGDNTDPSEIQHDASGLKGLSLPSVPKLPVTRTGVAIRVRPELLDRLVNQTGEVITTRTRLDAEAATLRSSLKELTVNLGRLRQQLHEMELQAETQMQARLVKTRETDQIFDPLELDRFTRVQEIARMMAESVNDVATVQRNLQRAVESTEDGLIAMGRQTRELQRDLLRTRMVEFEGISERLYRVVRQATKETGKQVRLDITGGHIEMDRGVLDRMTSAFEHVLRNCVVHGVEMPEVRLAAGKPAEGQIHIHLAQELNDVSVVFEDDGAGLDLPRLREQAVAMGVVFDSSEISDAKAAELVFKSGLSTARKVTTIAGRGVGMDVVRNDVAALGGRVEINTTQGKGTAFKLVLPLTTAVTQVVMLRAGSLTAGVPSSLVERVRRLKPAELAEAYAKGILTVDAEEVPFYWAGALLQTSPQTLQQSERTLPVVIFRSAAQRVAMHVDEVLGNQEVVVKNLGSQLSRLPGLAGMSVLASGAVVLIYNPVALAAVYGSQVSDWLTAQTVKTRGTSGADEEEVPGANAVPLVLVVDDSITVRRVTQRLLQREGYRVTLAADGLQAVEQMQQELPSVVLSDIEMPRMDGLELLKHMRQDKHLKNVPVIMITSRIAEKHREHAQELGINHYLGKPYPEEELLSLIACYTKSAAAEA